MSSSESGVARPDASEALRTATTWALLAHPYHDSPLGPPYAAEIEDELRRRGFIAPFRGALDVLIGVFLRPILLDPFAWPEPKPPNLLDILFCLGVWSLAMELGGAAVCVVAAVASQSRTFAAVGGVLILVAVLPLATLVAGRLLYFRLAGARDRRRKRGAA